MQDQIIESLENPELNHFYALKMPPKDQSVENFGLLELVKDFKPTEKFLQSDLDWKTLNREIKQICYSNI